MVQNYMEFQNQNKLLQTLKPNIRKMFIKNVLKITGIVILIVMALLIVHWQAGLSTLFIPFESFGIKINQSAVLIYSILIVIGLALVLLTANYFAIVNLRYELYQDKFVVYENYSLVFVKSKEIPYQNIIKISYENENFLNCGTITLELSGMKEGKVMLKFIDNVEQAAQYLQNVAKEFTSIQQAQFTENYKIGKIVDKY